MPATVIRVKVKPNARTTALTWLPDGSWVAQVRAPAIEGRANQELISLVAEHFHCVKAAVSIKRGASGRLKLVRIAQSECSSWESLSRDVAKWQFPGH
jgi:uncharacterized protein